MNLSSQVELHESANGDDEEPSPVARILADQITFDFLMFAVLLGGKPEGDSEPRTACRHL
jgi:hypothetical protein